MAIIRLQSDIERQKHLYYEFDSTDNPLGEGGMGKVYKGRCVNERTGVARNVAIKFMFNDVPEHVIERARREASIQLRNDNLVEMLGFIEINDKSILGENKKRYHVVSELLEGVMLDDLLQGKTTDPYGNPIPFAQKLYNDYQNNPFQFAVFVIRNILSGIMALHDAGYIHRDIDPTNIMVTKDEHIKLIDFGIAKQLNLLNTQDKALTNAGVFIGKPWYAAPELVLGDVKYQNQTTDIYTIGILFFQLYMKQRPFEGANHDVLDMQLHKSMPLKVIPHKGIKKIIRKATNKKQELRYQSAAEFRVDVDNLKIIPPNPLNLRTKWIVGSFAIAIVVFLIVWGIILPHPKPPLSPQPIENYQEAVKMLKSNENEYQGIASLKKLSEQNDYNATYLLSRLYFDAQYKKKYDNVPDSIWQLQIASHFQPDHKEVTELLQKAVLINPNDCNSLYDLGVEYFIGNRETLEERDIEKAKKYLNKALEEAEKCGNRKIITAIANLKGDYPEDLGK